MSENLENQREVIIEQTNQLYKANNWTYWNYSLTCFKSCITMNPKKKSIEKIKEAQPYQALHTQISYDNELFSKNDINCMKSCSNKLGFLESKRLEFDSAFEKESLSGNIQKAFMKTPRKISQK